MQCYITQSYVMQSYVMQCYVTQYYVTQCTFRNICMCGPGSSVGIATELRAGRSGDRVPVEARFSAPVQTGPGAHPASCTMGTGSFPRGKYGRGVMLTTHPLLVPWSWKSRAIPLPTLWATTGPVTGTLCLYICISVRIIDIVWGLQIIVFCT